ncbi:MAG: class I SAM-dependent methyltransferase [Anaerolineae bacterium]|jgi:SAM-dependent methyltransferase
MNPDTRVDYDRIAPSYNERYAVSDTEQISHALIVLAEELTAERTLEVGCGTGRWLADLQPVARQVCGLDPSSGMLREALERSADLQVVRGLGGHVPFSDATFDLVYCVNAIHHFDGQRSFVASARRLLRPNGALAVIGMDPHSPWLSWYIYDYFEGVLERDLRRFPSWGTVLDWMVACGFTKVTWRPVKRILDRMVGREVLDNPFLQKHACSQLALLTDQAYAAGLHGIKEALTKCEASGEPLTFSTDILLAMLVGRTSEEDTVI